MDFILMNTFKITLMPKTSIKYNNQKNCFFYLIAKNEVTLLNRKKNQKLNSGDEAIINLDNVELYNNSKGEACVEGFLFRTGHSTSYLKKIYVMRDLLFNNKHVIELLTVTKCKIISICQNFFVFEHESFEKKIDTRLLKVNRYIRTHYKEIISLNMLSELIDTNPVYLCNTYSRVFGFPPIYHLNTLKINEAKRLLINTSLSIKEIVDIVGFSNNSQFSSLFKRYVNQSPIEFKNKIINERIKDNSYIF
uniref:helix-turn-helix domain-containing protein n=1 Tax=Paenibacillus sp. FSL R7-0272 TaxID=2921679 RepID=UPI003A6D7671